MSAAAAPTAAPAAVKPEVDLFRDTPLRYLGYANELGESFRPLIPRPVVSFSYLLAIGYVGADTIDKAAKTAKAYDAALPTITAEVASRRYERSVRVGVSAFDTLVWQGFASVAVPGAVVYALVQSTRWACKRVGASKRVLQVLPTAVGLCSIPAIIHPIDHAVDHAMDRVVRPFVNDRVRPWLLGRNPYAAKPKPTNAK